MEASAIDLAFSALGIMLDPTRLMALSAGVLVGLMIGVIPGLGGVVGMALLLPGLWRVHLPLMAAYNQGPVLAMMDEAYAAGGRLVLYRHVSFAVLFYGGQRWAQPQVTMLHTSKFSGDPEVLDGVSGTPVYVVAKRQAVPRLLREHPGLLRVRELGDLALYMRPAL